MSINSSTTELAGINTVSDLFLDYDGYVLPSLNSQEKGIAWDGSFIYYDKGIQDKKHYYDECRVQVKGQHVADKDIDKKIISYKVDMDDLSIYRKKGGVIYFVVCISKECPERRQAYYNSLLPFDITKIMDNKQGVKEPSIKLKRVPDTNGKRRNLVKSFIDNSKEQMKSYEAKIPVLKDLIMDADKWDMGIITPFDQLFDDSVYIYRSPKGLPDYKQAVMKVQIHSIATHMKGLEIALDEKVYYKEWKHIVEKDNVHKIRFGKCLEFSSQEDNTATIKFAPKGRIDDIIRDAEFIKAMLSAKVFRMGGYSSDLVNMKYDGIDDALEFAGKIKRLFKKLHIDKELDLTVCSDKMYNDFMTLYEGIIKKKPVIYDLNDKRIIRSLNIYGAHIPVVFVQNKNGELHVYDMFDISKGKYTVGWKIDKYADMRTTVYTMLYKENFMGLGKRNCDNLKKCIKDIEFNQLHGDKLVNMLIEMVKAYYEEKSNLLFNIIKYLARYLLKNEPSNINLINYYMVCDIDNEITDRGKMKLENRLKYIENEEKEIKYAAALYILLDKKEEFVEKFNTMSEEDKNYFREMPIMKLAERKFGRINGGSEL